MTRNHFGEVDAYFREDGAICGVVRRQQSGEKSTFKISKHQPESMFQRLGGACIETDLLEIEEVLASYEQELECFFLWYAKQNMRSKNTQGEAIGPTLARVRRECKHALFDCRRVEVAIRRGDPVGASLLSLKIASAVFRKRVLVDMVNDIKSGMLVRRSSRDEGARRKRQPKREAFLLQLFAEARKIHQRSPKLSVRAIAERLCKPGAAGYPRKAETVRKLITKEIGSIP